MIFGETLREIRYDVAEAANGREALEVIAVQKSNMHLVLADWNMLGLNRLDLVKELRQDPAFSSLAIVMVTTARELDQMEAALDTGANEYVMKPFTPKTSSWKSCKLAGILP